MGKDVDVDFSMLDGTVDDLADLKGFEPIPAGTHKLEISSEKKAINGLPAVILNLKVVEVLELADPSKDVCEPGKTSNIAFILKTKDGKRNEVGEGQLKEVIKILAPAVGGSSILETMEKSNGAVIVATLKVRADKNDEDKKYNQIKSCDLA